MVMLPYSLRLEDSLKCLSLCCSPVLACLAGRSFFLPVIAEFWCPAWLTGPQWDSHVSQSLSKHLVCNSCRACVISAQHQWEEPGPADSRGRETIRAGCGSSGLVSVQGPVRSASAYLKAGLTPQTKLLEASPHYHSKEERL